jgi:hypothetical protein
MSTAKRKRFVVLERARRAALRTRYARADGQRPYLRLVVGHSDGRSVCVGLVLGHCGRFAQFAARCRADLPWLRERLTVAGARVRSNGRTVSVWFPKREAAAALDIVRAYLDGGSE